ncbi:MAG: DUF2778 domain-containing protein [Methylobacterium sp.]|nr:DUF2778 domain-containing protein [Methylobacterium sp.]
MRAAAVIALSGLAIVISSPFSGTAPPVGGLGGGRDPSPLQERVAEAGSNAGSPVSSRLPEPETPPASEAAVPVEGGDAQTLFAELAPIPPVETPPLPDAHLPAQTVPLPMPRPPELRGPPSSDPSRRASRQNARRTNIAAVPLATEDDRSFFEKLFGIGGQQTPALAYAALESPSVDLGARRRLTPLPVPDGGGAVAIYNISARTVTLPNGETLEAHSGLGESMDDPRYVDRRMRGATPPGTYDLTEREQLFHGVRALRLNPIGGSAAVHNRTGLLAHSYLLGPSGASNGCVSFKDYQKFLTAYLRGEFQRLVVVPGQGQDVLPVVASRAAKVPGRLARGSGNMRVATLP